MLFRDFIGPTPLELLLRRFLRTYEVLEVLCFFLSVIIITDRYWIRLAILSWRLLT